MRLCWAIGVVEVSPTLSAWVSAIVRDEAKAVGAPFRGRAMVAMHPLPQPQREAGTPAAGTQTVPSTINPKKIDLATNSQLGSPISGTPLKVLGTPDADMGPKGGADSLTAANRPEGKPQPPGTPPKPKMTKEQLAQQKRLSDLLALAGGPHNLLRQIRKHRAETSLYEFVKQAWQYMDPVEFKDSWHIKAICDHLEQVTRGNIKRLIINIPPRCSKSTLVCVAWPAWVWAQSKHSPLSGPHVQMLFASYAQTLSERDSVKTRRLIESAWYQENWGTNYKIVGDQNTKRKYETNKGGYRLATSVDGTLTGEGGACITIDDSISATDANSETVRNSTNAWWDETMSTRLNDPATGAFVVIQQRLHDEDTTGHILAKDKKGEYTHVMLPMEFDPRRRCETYIKNELFFCDPREDEGDLLCPDRFDRESVENLKRELGPYGAAGQLQQSPSPRGGGILKREWWKLWPPEGEEDLWIQDLPDAMGDIKPRITYPDFDFIFASVDTAYTEKEENDWSACTVWGTFAERKTGEPKIMLISAWRDRLPLNDLVQRIMRTATRKNLACEAVIVENKASGISVMQELKRLMRPGAFTVYPFDPRKDGGGDKVARMYAAQPSFAAGLIFAPDTTWAEMVIAECEAAPKGKYMDLCDTVSMGVNWLRKRGLARMKFEHEDDVRPKPWGGNGGGVADRYGI